MMKRILTLAALMALIGATADAACYADYKAKRDNPLKLHYGVIELPDTACRSKKAAAAQIRGRLAPDGWVLLNVLSVFDQGGLEQRKDSAGEFFLRY